MDKNSSAMEPVTPSGMHILLDYECPHCHRSSPVNAPSQPSLMRCPWCGTRFPIIPIDPYLMQYLRIMTCDGKATSDPDFL